MTIKVLFWNIWLENQIRGIKKSENLLDELETIISKYNPDCIGLNEVIKHSEHEIPLINAFLEKKGYKYHYFSNGSPFTNEWDIGSALCSKYPLTNVQEIELGRNITAEKKGHFKLPVKAIAAKLKKGINIEAGIIVAHPINLKPGSIIDHFRHTKVLADFINSSGYSTCTIIGGDFNEPMFFPRSFKRLTRNQLHHKTGTKRNPTWRHNTWKKTPLRANLDRLFWTNDDTLELVDFNIIECHVSDHKPIYAKFNIIDAPK